MDIAKSFYIWEYFDLEYLFDLMEIQFKIYSLSHD